MLKGRRNNLFLELKTTMKKIKNVMECTHSWPDNTDKDYLDLKADYLKIKQNKIQTEEALIV